MKVIFLDVDGVLNDTKCKVKTPSGFPFVEDELIIRLKQIIDATGAKVVLSSTWRQGYYDLERGVKGIAATDYILLRDKLLSFGIEIFDHTPIIKSWRRGTEIALWLQETKYEIDAIVVLDDKYDVDPLGQFLVRTSVTEGLRTKHVIKAIRMLNGQSIHNKN